MDSLLITGASGFVGGNLTLAASHFWKTWVTCHASTIPFQGSYTVCEMDIQNPAQVSRVISEIAPSAIIHTAAMTSVDKCAREQESAWRVNVAGTENIVRAANRVKARVVYLSTDMVFAGDRGFYAEEDEPHPICHYGKTKLEAERVVAALSSNYCIARSALIYGRSVTKAKCFTETAIERWQNSSRVELFNDEYRSPIYIQNLCQVLLELAQKQDLQGIYHICGMERMSRFELGAKVCEIFGFAKELILPVSASTMHGADPRPADCSMKNDKAKQVLQTRFHIVEEGLLAMKKSSGMAQAQV